MSDKNCENIVKYTTWLINKNDILAQCNSLDSTSFIKGNSRICLMQWSKTYKQTNNKYKWLFFSITRHSLYWESPQFSLFVSYYGPLTWPHLPKTHFPISTRKKHIYLCHLIMYKRLFEIGNCFTAVIILSFLFMYKFIHIFKKYKKYNYD